MLVDLGRNDLGRVSQVRHRARRRSDVHRALFARDAPGVFAPRRTAATDVDRWDTLMACFPAGTVSGAPKVRAMEIIDELEPTKRGVYAGAIMYAGLQQQSGFVHRDPHARRSRNKGYIQAGGGIVADSVPENEYMETVNKSRALIRAINLAQRGFEL